MLPYSYLILPNLNLIQSIYLSISNTIFFRNPIDCSVFVICQCKKHGFPEFLPSTNPMIYGLKVRWPLASKIVAWNVSGPSWGLCQVDLREILEETRSLKIIIAFPRVSFMFFPQKNTRSGHYMLVPGRWFPFLPPWLTGYNDLHMNIGIWCRITPHFGVHRGSNCCWLKPPISHILRIIWNFSEDNGNVENVLSLWCVSKMS